MIRSRILSDCKNCFCLKKIFQGHGTFADSDRFSERGATGLVAQVRAGRQVVRSELPGKKLKKIGRFVTGSPRSVEGSFIRRPERIKLASDQVKSVIQSIAS